MATFLWAIFEISFRPPKTTVIFHPFQEFLQQEEADACRHHDECVKVLLKPLEHESKRYLEEFKGALNWALIATSVCPSDSWWTKFQSVYIGASHNFVLNKKNYDSFKTGHWQSSWIDSIAETNKTTETKKKTEKAPDKKSQLTMISLTILNESKFLAIKIPEKKFPLRQIIPDCKKYHTRCPRGYAFSA